MIKLFKFIALLFPCLSLSACTFDDIPTPLIYNNHNAVKKLVDDDYIQSFINGNNVILSYSSLSTYSTELGSLIYSLNSQNAFYGLNLTFYDSSNNSLLINQCAFGNTGSQLVQWFISGSVELFAFRSNDNGNTWFFSPYPIFTSTCYITCPFNNAYGFAELFLDSLRLDNAVDNPFDISSYGFVKNGFYCFDFLRFQKNYGLLMTDYSLATITTHYHENYSNIISTFTETMGASNSLFYTTEGSSNVYLNFPFQQGSSTFTPYLYFPLSASNYYASFESYTADDFPLDKFNYGQSDYTLSCLSFDSALGLVMYRDYTNFSSISINADNNYSNQYSYSFTGMQNFYIYFVCDKPLLMNNLYYNKTNINYLSNFIPINRYIDSIDNVFITKLYEAYISSFTYIADFTDFMTTSNQYNSYIVGCYSNTSTYFEDNPPTFYQVNMTDLSSLTIRKNDEGHFRFVDSATGNLYKYLVLMIYDRRDRSLTPYFNGSNPNQIFIRSVNQNTWGVGIGNHLYLGLNAENSATVPNCMFTIYNAFDNGYNYSKTYDIVGGAEAVYIPVNSSTFYQYMFGILDTPLYMISQTFVVPFDFNILALLLALVGLSIAMFILRLII